jgi:hypothetical protein
VKGWHEEKDSVTIVKKVPAVLMDSKTSRDEKMVWLRYLIHVVGDLHQPLHVGNGMDMGANLCYVKWIEPATKTAPLRVEYPSLHSVWDDELFGSIKKVYLETHPQDHYFDYVDLAPQIEKNNPESALGNYDKTAAADVSDWIKESQALHKQVYIDRPGLDTPATRPYCKTIQLEFGVPKRKMDGSLIVINGAFDPKVKPEITEDYKARAVRAIESQIMKAGLRLAYLINKMAKDSAVVVDPMDKGIAGILEKLNLIND